MIINNDKEIIILKNNSNLGSIVYAIVYRRILTHTMNSLLCYYDFVLRVKILRFDYRRILTRTMDLLWEFCIAGQNPTRVKILRNRARIIITPHSCKFSLLIFHTIK